MFSDRYIQVAFVPCTNSLYPFPGPMQRRIKLFGGADAVTGMVVSVLPGECLERVLSGPGTHQLKTLQVCACGQEGLGQKDLLPFSSSWFSNSHNESLII